MSKKQIKRIVGMGIGCVILLAAGIVYSLLYNEGRWGKEMDMSEYVFSVRTSPCLELGV